MKQSLDCFNWTAVQYPYLPMLALIVIADGNLAINRNMNHTLRWQFINRFLFFVSVPPMQTMHWIVLYFQRYYYSDYYYRYFCIFAVNEWYYWRLETTWGYKIQVSSGSIRSTNVTMLFIIHIQLELGTKNVEHKRRRRRKNEMWMCSFSISIKYEWCTNVCHYIITIQLGLSFNDMSPLILKNWGHIFMVLKFSHDLPLDVFLGSFIISHEIDVFFFLDSNYQLLFFNGNIEIETNFLIMESFKICQLFGNEY